MTPSPTARRVARRVVGVFAVVLGVLGASAPGAAATLPRAEVQAQQWWINRLGLQDAWKITEGSGVTVAVIDSGVDARFGDLRGAVGTGFGVRVSGNGQRDTDPAYHGTRMADVLAGRGSGFGLKGVAPQASILPVSINYSIGGGNPEDSTAALTKLTAMADPPAVVNMSYGADTPCPASLQTAVKAATTKGMILVAAAGNTPSEDLTPANCVGVVAVGAYGDGATPVAWAGTARQSYVALSGPGVKMIGYSTSAPSGYGYATGTSDAAAIVSGTFALVRKKFPTLSPRDVVTRVLYTARQFDGAQGTRNSTWGYGVARTYAALTESVPASAPNPIYDALQALGTPSSSPSASAPTTNSPTTNSPTTAGPGSTGAESDDSGSSSTGLIIGIVVAALVVLLVVVALVLRGRRRSPAGPSGPPPPGWG